MVSDFVGKPVSFGVRPEDIYDPANFPANLPEAPLRAKVEVIEPMGSEQYVYMTTGGNSFIARLEAHIRLEVEEEQDLKIDLSNEPLSLYGFWFIRLFRAQILKAHGSVISLPHLVGDSSQLEQCLW